MKKLSRFLLVVLLGTTIWSCGEGVSSQTNASSDEAAPVGLQSAITDNESAKDVVKIAASSPDHTTLVAAVKQAGLVDALSNQGPFTVFAPTNAAFDKLPKGTVEDLLKPENKEKLTDILQYHVYVGNLKTDYMQDGQTYNQVNGGNITISKKDGKVTVNNSAVIVASIPAANGIIHVIDGVLLPPTN